MEPKSNNVNTVLFMVVSVLILIGSMAFQAWQQSKIKRPPDLGPWMDVYARTSTAASTPAVPGIGSALQMLTNVEVADWLGKHRYRLPLDLIVKNEPPPTPPKVAPKPVAKQPRRVVELGSDNTNLHIKLTSRGASVLSVTLNQFQAADADGKPLPDRLELVPEDANEDNPSNQLLHYENMDDDRPVETLGEMDWELVSEERGGADRPDKVLFAGDVPGSAVRIIKTYTLWPADYHLGLSVQIQRRQADPSPLKFRYQVTSGHGSKVEGVWYTYTFHNALVGSVGKGKSFSRDFQDSRTIGVKDGGERVMKGDSERIEYAAICNQYFASAVAVTDKIDPNDANERPQRQDFLAFVRPTVEAKLDKEKPQLDDIVMRAVTEPLDVPASDPLTQNYILYYGPVKVRLLDSVASGGKSVPPQLVRRYIDQLHLNTLTDYHSPGIMGSISSSIFWTDLIIFFTNLMHGVLGWMHSLIPSYGICIILMTICVRAIMHPVSRKQARTSMKMQALAPEIKKMQEKYKNDPQARGMAQLELYRKHGVSPMGSCWIILLQMPIFMGLYYSLQESIFFRLQPFLWIENLAAPDMLFTWGPNVPILSEYLGPCFNILPIVAVSLMLVQQKFLMPPPTNEQEEINQKVMKFMMVVMGFMFYKMPAGLCVYFIVSTLWGLTERKLLPKAKPAASPAVTAATAPAQNRNGAPRSKSRAKKEMPANGTFQKISEMWTEILKQARKK
jgi:YidC/Oxa1 family membrane protein insertase